MPSMFQSINGLPIILLSLVIAYLRNPIYSENRITAQLDPAASSGFAGNILLLTAHPDDECMFFAPTILALAALQQPTVSGSRDPRSALYSLCLSVGDADGLGPIRKYELESSLDILGVDSDKRMVLDHPDLQDNFTAYWDAQTIATVLKPYILENRINTILTFDREGVSGHPNHKSLPAGVKELMASLKEVRLFTLITTPLPAKYGGLLAPSLAKFDLYANAWLHFLETQLTRVLLALDISISSAPTKARPETMPVFVSGMKEYWAAVQAMRAHPSQLVWFRWLYVLFSRYMWVNEWNEVRVV
ncbi:N-acetylglucosaminylphosphatidylinositoldeacety la se [Mycena rosella]|uniref:N-acetylglucosaminylphosphatidylinositol deacetylase n=1 Tax=Mycena rosella TaxID=1033263 RepID=A0AAD7GU52_MYCRO|nr:N-acetylglucosaminylphosphatidylinositoldeacety la se [Mycena rosella]